DVLIPGIMEHIERAGVHSGDSIAVYPPYNLSDAFLERICEVSVKLALALGTKGLVNIQYLIYDNELYVIEVNPRASRTVPYISKVTNVPMVDLAAQVMLGAKLADLGYGTGLYRTPPYYAVKVPVFSFEKLNDANSILGPEMKSTGEVLGIGRTLAEALFKGLTSAGFTVPPAYDRNSAGVLLSVETEDYQEIIPLARRLEELGLKLFATTGTAAAIASAGLPVTSVDNAAKSSAITDLMEQGEIKYIIYTGAVKDATMGDFIALHRRAMMLGIPCLTSLDTANALADMMASRFGLGNTELVDINDMRTQPQHISFTKMQDCGNDYIFIENFDGSITCPEALCVILCRPHYGIGADGIVLMERSETADVRMRSFNRDGSEGKMAGNNLRCIGKYMYDKGYVTGRTMTVETAGGTKQLSLFIRDGKVSSVAVDMGKAELDPAKVPVDVTKLPAMSNSEKTGAQNATQTPVLDRPAAIGGKEYRISCVSVGNPHCVVFTEDLESLDVASIGPKFEYSELFPDRVNAEFVRKLGPDSLRVKVWERGSGETLACGTGACAAVIAAAENGLVEKGRDIKVSLPGGDLTVNYTDERVILTGSAQIVYEGSFEY
ncbi:MAG: diaminopimelate epimerase, partial [Firmicutes bacterium]|nr:diaminopimelate epimerase [Bacillota bacterium]